MAHHLLGLTLVLLLSLPGAPWAAGGRELYAEHCQGCHTLGGGDSGGPDLAGIADQRPLPWLEQVIVAPDKLSAAKDPLQLELVAKYGYEMPNLGLSAADARAIIAYLKEGGTAATPAAAAATPLTPELIAAGAAYFSGARPFAAGGAPCGACHALAKAGLAGGNLAADLSDLYNKAGESGMRGLLKALKFPIMKTIYHDKALTDEEIAALIALAASAGDGRAAPAGPLLAGGAALFAGLMIGLVLYKRRIG